MTLQEWRGHPDSFLALPVRGSEPVPVLRIGLGAGMRMEPVQIVTPTVMSKHAHLKQLRRRVATLFDAERFREAAPIYGEVLLLEQELGLGYRREG